MPANPLPVGEGIKLVWACVKAAVFFLGGGGAGCAHSADIFREMAGTRRLTHTHVIQPQHLQLKFGFTGL